jgi:RHS repeat-associated protein
MCTLVTTRLKPSGPALVLCLLAGVFVEAFAQNLQPSRPPVQQLEYDAEGNLTKLVRAPGTTAAVANLVQHDRLQRPTLLTDPSGGVTQLTHDAQDRLRQVQDPRNLLTQYGVNGLGDMQSLQSPDTGASTFTTDAAGNLRTRLDSRGVLARYSYDALNRLTGVMYSSGRLLQRFSWLYDQTGPGFSHGAGRLTSTLFPAGNTAHAYDALGRMVLTSQTIASRTPFTWITQYGYDAAGRTTSMVYPSGRVLYVSRAGGLPTAMSLAANSSANAVPLLSGMQFEPTLGGAMGSASSSEGPARSWFWHLDGGTAANAREFDTSGRMVRHPLGGAVRNISYDGVDRVNSFTHTDAFTGAATAASNALNQSFTYDSNSRLNRVATNQGQWFFGYDANGNRTQTSFSNRSTSTRRTSSIANDSNRLLAMDNPSRSFGHDAAGNTFADQQGHIGWTANHDLSGRIDSHRASRDGRVFTTVFYWHNADGLRIYKQPHLVEDCPTGANGPCTPLANAARPTAYVYDQQGQLLGEYDGVTGEVRREYVWLQGAPVAVVDGPPSNPSIFYIHTDHLGTPRVAFDRAGRQRWSWVAEPFGNSSPVTNPLGLGDWTLNLRMPGQYFDVETGLSYNWHRTYDAGVGRYTQSDPIGLAGGINTYAYVGGNPVSYVDPEGLQGVQPAPMLRPQPQIPGPAGQYPYIRPEWNYPGLPEAQQLTRVCVRTSCPVDQPQICTTDNPTGASTQWKQGPFISAPGGLSSACVCLEYGWGVGPNPLPVTPPSLNQNSGQPPGMLQRLIRLLR